MFTRLLAIVTLAAAANAYWTFGGTALITQTRLDSIVNPDTIGTHVHAIVGASGFSNHYDPDELMKSNCTTIPVQPDLSNYWSPQLYHRDKDTGEFSAMPTGFNIYYLPRPGPKNETIKAFPKGLRMLAGDTTRRTFNASSHADQAITYVCLTDTDSPQTNSMPTQQCVGGLRAQVFFPSCWDGVNLDSPDHKSHMAYPIQNFDSGDCPDTHPVHLISLFYEMGVNVGQFDFHGVGTWVLANGDTTGFGLHADFQNGWDIDLLQDAIDQCSGASGNVHDCAPLEAVFDQAAADACVFQGDLVAEDIGLTSPIAALPGCNPVFGSGDSTSSCSGTPNPGLVPAQNPLPAGWTEVGCIAEGTNGRALPALTMSSSNLTRSSCASFCASHGFSLAGAEFSDECYCDNALKNGATGALLSWDACANRCTGNNNEICGGGSKLTLMTNAGAVSASKSSRRALRFDREES
ncbi:WSC-domain-containing protein [Trametes versicolor FP-101664 SS1]|uniref:WSC-domain-containing protein n=1 Tax=Trametes versicolor (strain FP-101664) TaxID=717944 RepID=UPI0004621603|nr:WSC-domain-containing protein [Trametes versicolor FP-101664 SS1]EIW54702.1 WSC-domain-containing protein [Trametes versicolor FP-101664 SS1]